jgi:hypothetical protein
MLTCLIHNYFICLKLTPLLCVVVDEENKKLLLSGPTSRTYKRGCRLFFDLFMSLLNLF